MKAGSTELCFDALAITSANLGLSISDELHRVNLILCERTDFGCCYHSVCLFFLIYSILLALWGNI